MFYFVPVVNVFYDMWFDTAPHLAQVNECMATFGLIAGLMVTVAQAVMNTLSSEDVETYKETNYGGSYDAFKFWGPTGFALLSASMLAVVVHYLASSCSDVENMSPEVYRAWWVFVRGNIGITFALTVMGLTGVMLSAMHLFILQHSDSEEEALELNNWTMGTLCGFVMGGCGVSIPWLCMSLGLLNYKRVEAQIEEVPLSVDDVYRQLDEYKRSCPEENFFYMQKEEFLESLVASVGKTKYHLTPMSQEFAALAFDTFKDEQMKLHLRTSVDVVAKDLNKTEEPLQV